MSPASETFSIDLDALVRICQGAASADSDGFERELRDCGIPAALRGYVMRQVETGNPPYDSHMNCRSVDEVDDAYTAGFDDGKHGVLRRLRELADEVLANPKEGQAA